MCVFIQHAIIFGGYCYFIHILNCYIHEPQSVVQHTPWYLAGNREPHSYYPKQDSLCTACHVKSHWSVVVAVINASSCKHLLVIITKLSELLILCHIPQLEAWMDEHLQYTEYFKLYVFNHALAISTYFITFKHSTIMHHGTQGRFPNANCENLKQSNNTKDIHESRHLLTR